MSFCWTRRRASTSRSGTSDLSTHIGPAEGADGHELAVAAAQTFPLACPPSVSAADIAAFIEANLSPACFTRYLADPERAILTVRRDGRIMGYAMLIRGGNDGEAVELSKIYLAPDLHGTGVAARLMESALATATAWDAPAMWLGVNQKNARAQRFYTKHGFRVTGTRTFQLGDHLEHDYVMTRDL